MRTWTSAGTSPARRGRMRTEGSARTTVPSVGPVEADPERRLEVVPRVGAEGDVRVGLQRARDLVDPAGHHLGDLVELAHPHDRDEVDVAGDGVHLADPVEVGDRL